jgi:3-beta hydroxysteroid dehydrogenase/isomerase family.
MHAHNIDQLIYTSTPNITHNNRTPIKNNNKTNTPYGHGFKTPYPTTKLITELKILTTNNTSLSTITLRPHLI